MRLLFLILCLCAIAAPALGEGRAPRKRPRPAPTPTEAVEKPAAADDEPPPSTPVDKDPDPAPSLPRFDPSWRACREDKDCVPIDTRCGWGCINGAFVQPASMYYRQLAPFIECAATSDVKPNAICVKKECVCQK